MRKSIKAIGQCAIRIDAAAERCVHVLLELIATRVSYVVQESIVVMKVGIHVIDLSFSGGSLNMLRTSSANIPRDMRALSRRSLPA